jgi:hypothetical protein
MEIMEKSGSKLGRPKKTKKKHLSIHMKESGVLGFWGIMGAILNNFRWKTQELNLNRFIIIFNILMKRCILIKFLL